MSSISLVGGTGLVGSHILSTLLSNPSITSVTAYTRRALPSSSPSPKLHAITNPDSSTWATSISTSPPPPDIFISALGTTKAAAGSISAQRQIDIDLNLALAQAAHSAGVHTYVLISGGFGGSDGTQSSNAYVRMKAELEVAVKQLGFEHTVIVKPGLIVGDRKESRPIEAVVRGVAKVLGAVSGGVLKDMWAQDANVIARAAVRAGLEASQGKSESKVWEVQQKDILRLGREA